MHPERLAVFFPCHSLDDFPIWLDEPEADELLAAWTAAWHPALIAAVGAAPGWMSVEVPPSDPAGLLGIVPPACDERFAAMLDIAGLAGSHFVRQVHGHEAIIDAARGIVAAQGVTVAADTPFDDDFQALGLAWLLAELLARRMRSSTGIVADDFAAAVVAAARAAVAGDEPAAREKLRECFAALEATRSQYYAVDVWLLDLVLVAASTLGGRLASELASPVPLGLVVTGNLLEQVGRDDPALLERLRVQVAAGAVEIVGGRDDATPVDCLLLESLAASLDRGQAICRELVGAVPTTFGQCTGGSSAFLPQLLVERGYRGTLWNLFDGTPLPDPGTSRIRWQGHEGSCIDAVAHVPLDARAAGTILQVADKIGNAMDHDHSCIVSFAHYAGTASPWFAVLRRIASWTTLLGRFVTPATLFAETEHAGALADFPADAFPPGLPPDDGAGGGDLVGERVAAAEVEARSLAEPVPTLDHAVQRGTDAGPATHRGGEQAGILRGLLGGFGRSRNDADTRFVLENGAVRIAVHPRTGGLVSLRGAAARANRLSQVLAVRSTRPAPPVGSAWESVEERAEYSRMVAERIDRESDTRIVSQGTLVATSGARLGSFTQRFTLVGALPLVRLEIDVHLDRPLDGPLFESHVACRFAWNENDDIDLCRSLHGESIVTERSRFTAPHFLELRSAGDRTAADRVLIATGGLPWHVRCTPHTVDTILMGPGVSQASRRLVLGLGIAEPRPVALSALCEQAALPTAAGAMS